MSSFTRFSADLHLKYRYNPASEKDYWIVLEPFEYYLEDNPDVIIRIPAGFITDGASVPKWLQWILPPWGPYGQAAVLHDYLLEVGQMRNKRGHFVYCKTRKEAREHFSDAMKVLKVPEWRRLVLSVGVFVWDQFKEDKLR